MRYVKGVVDFIAVPFILIGGIACMIFSAAIAGWVVTANWYHSMSDDE
jgi:hypothetical protein